MSGFLLVLYFPKVQNILKDKIRVKEREKLIFRGCQHCWVQRDKSGRMNPSHPPTKRQASRRGCV